MLGGLNLGLIGCGGGGDADPAPAEPAPMDERRLPLGGVDSGGTGGRVRSMLSAMVSLTAPLTIGNVRLATSAASRICDADGNALAEQDLLPGMGARVEAGAITSIGIGLAAQAWSITVGEQLLAHVTAVDVAGRSFVALGQRVVVTAGTLFDGSVGGGGLSGLHVGMLVRVWGQLDSAGQRIVATRIGALASASQGVLRGVLSAIDRHAGRATVGGVELAFSAADAALIAVDVSPGALVRARLSAPALGTAPSLQSLRGDAWALLDQVEAEIDGRVTRFDSAQRFAVDGVEVDASHVKTVEGAAWLALGARVQVHGRSVQGLLVADALAVQPDEPVELEGTITAFDKLRQRFVLRGTEVAWSSATVFIGGSAKQLQSPRRRAAVVGRWSADRSHVLAARIHLET